MSSELAALVIEHKIAPHQRERYEKWLTDGLAVVAAAPGFIHRDVFPPASPERPYVLVVRFDSAAHAASWMNSPELAELTDQVTDLFDESSPHQVTLRAGVDVWFPPSAGQTPSAVRQVIVLYGVVLVLSWFLPRLLMPLLTTVPVLSTPLIAHAIVNAAIVASLTYAIMPLVMRLLHPWLYPRTLRA